MADYFIRQCEEVKFCHCNYSGEEDLKYSLRQYYFEYLKKESAKIRLMRKHKAKPMSEEEYLKRLDEIESKFIDIRDYFLELSKKDDEKMKDEFMEQVRFNKIKENYNKGQKDYSLRRRIMEDNSPF